LEDGSGIVLLQGLDPSRYSLDEPKLLYAAIARQVGDFVYSNRAGEVMREIRLPVRPLSVLFGNRWHARHAAMASLPTQPQTGAQEDVQWRDTVCRKEAAERRRSNAAQSADAEPPTPSRR
jgi:hypothetical protein